VYAGQPTVARTLPPELAGKIVGVAAVGLLTTFPVT